MAKASTSALTAAEKKSIAAAKTGEMTEFDEHNKPEIRASVLQRLICGVPQAGRKTADPVLPTGLKIRNAQITGKLDLAGWPGRADDPALPLPGLHFENCVFDEPVLISQSRFSYLRFWLCELKAIFGADARIDGPVELNGSTCTGAEHPQDGSTCALDMDNASINGNLELSTFFDKRFEADGEVRFAGAEISGQLSANGARLKNQNGNCLAFDGAVIKSDVAFVTSKHHRFDAEGEVRFLGAQVGGTFDASGARLKNENGDCLSFDGAVIKGDVFFDMANECCFESAGTVHLLGAQIDGSIFITGTITRSRINALRNYREKTENALYAYGSIIKGSIVFHETYDMDANRNRNTIKPNINGKVDFRNAKIGVWVARDCDFSGPMDMRGAHIGRLVDNPEAGWPKENGRLLLDGMVYDALQVVRDGKVDKKNRANLARDGEVDKKDLASRRLDWLKRQYKNPKKPTGDEFRPQPFVHLAQTLRKQGHDKEADKVAIALRRLQLRTVEDRWFMCVVLWLLDLTCSFGYSSRKAVLSLLIWLAIGTGMYGAHAFAGNFGPADEVALGRHDTKADSLVYWLPPSAPAHEKWRKTVRGCPGLVSPVYALDVMLPLIGLGQRRLCAFDPQGPAAPLWRFWHAFYAIMGAILSAIAILTLTGLLRKE